MKSAFRLSAWAVFALVIAAPPALSVPDFITRKNKLLPRKIKPSPAVQKAIQKGIQYLRGLQKADGSWEIYNISNLQQGGTTALTMLALLEAGVPVKDPAIQKGLQFLRTQKPSHTYVRALQTMVFAKAGLEGDRVRIQKNVNWLIEARVMGGKKLLGWTYTKPGKGAAFPDNSNTQYAVLGLHAGHLAGAKVPQAVWKSIREYYEATQTPDGGWIYTSRNFSKPYLTMTTAGVNGLVITHLALNRPNVLKDKAVQRGLSLVEKDFTVELPYRTYYSLYNLRNLGRLTGLERFGTHDWYQEGCTYLLKKQSPEDGSWPRAGQFDQWPAINTSFALVFLAP